MLCEMGCGKEKTRVKWSKYVCDDCEPKAIFNFLPVSTVNLRLYQRNKGNVSKARIDMIKSRCLHPDGSGEVVLKTKTGKITDRLASDY